MRYYSATAVRTQLTGSISASATIATVASTSGFPSSVPFTLLLEPGQMTEEVVSVTSIGGLTLTLARGQDGTSAVPHGVGADVRHGLSARDLREPQEHIAATDGVHGVVGRLVGDTDTQGLTNKSIDGNLNTLTNVPKTAMPSTTVYTTDSQILTNKTINGLSNTLTNVPKGALPGTVVYTADAQTLTNKTISSGTVGTVTIGDTGWVDVTATGGWNGTKQTRLRNDWVSLHLGLTRQATDWVAQDISFYTLATGLRPSRFMYATAWAYDAANGLRPVRVEVGSDGGVTFQTLSVKANGTVVLDFSFPLG